jgi:protein-tyrosine-phosphatase
MLKINGNAGYLRSPLAEAALRLAAVSVGIVMSVNSAGTGDWQQAML